MDGLGEGGWARQAAAARRLTEKLLANPNSALRNDSCWHMLPTDLKQTDYDLGEEWRGPEDTGDPSLAAQQPLLDGGKGKLIENRLKDNSTETPHNTTGLQVGYSPYAVVRGMEGDPPLASGHVPGGGSCSPALVSRGAVDHVFRLEATTGSTAFTPCHILGRAAPHGSEDAMKAPINDTMTERCLAGLEPPSLDSTGGHVTGMNTPQHRIEYKHH